MTSFRPPNVFLAAPLREMWTVEAYLELLLPQPSRKSGLRRKSKREKLPCFSYRVNCCNQSPRGHILKFFALASKPLVLENCPVLGSRTALFFESLKFCRSPEKKILKTFFWGERLKNSFEDLLFWRTIAPVSLVLGLGLEHPCPWPREGLSSGKAVLGRAVLRRAVLSLGFFLCRWPWPRALSPRLHLWL